MAENVHIDLSEEFEQDVVSMYSELCEELVEKMNIMYSELEEICGNTQFEPMLNVVNQTIELFNDEIYTVSTNAFEEWCDGEGSFTAAAENSEVGDEGLETARGIESIMRDTFEEFWTGRPFGEVMQMDTSRPKVKTEDYDELKEIYNKYSQELESIGEDAIKKVIENANDNPTYNIVIPALKSVTEPMGKAFEQFCIKIDEAKEISEEKKTQQDQKNEEASATTTQTAASAGDIAEALHMFKDL